MPQSAVRLEETHDSITRPVVMDVVRQFQKLTNSPLGTSIQYMGDIGVTYLRGDVIAEQEEFNTFEYSNKMKVQVTEDFDLEHGTMLDMSTWQKDNIAIFSDQALGVMINPIYAKMAVSVNCEFRLENATIADRFRNDLRIKAAQGRQDNLLEVNYNYGFPPEFIYILQQIYTLRENESGYGDDFEEYINNHSTKKLTTVTNLAGHWPRLVIGEKQIQVLGWFEFDGVPDKAEPNGDGAAVTVNFTYKFLYDKVVGCYIRYPLVIHNQMVPDSLYDERPAYSPTDRVRAPSMNRFFLDQFTGLFPLPSCCLDGISIPTFDDWLPDFVPPDTTTILSAICLIDLNNPLHLFDLDDLGNWDIDPDILKFIHEERHYTTQYGRGLLHLGLFTGSTPVTDGYIRIDDKLGVYSVNGLDLRARYHVRLSILNNLMLLDRRDVDRIRKHGKAVIKLFDQIQCGFSDGIYTPTLLSNGSISYADWQIVAFRVAAKKGMFYNGIEHAMMTVGNYTIVTYNQNTGNNHVTGETEPNESAAESGASDQSGDNESGISYCDRGHATEPPLFTSDIHRRTIVDS